MDPPNLGFWWGVSVVATSARGNGNFRRSWPLLRVALFLLVLLLALVTTLLWQRWQRLVRTINPAPVPRVTVAPGQVSPAHALLLLTDAPPSSLILSALDAQDPLSAYVLLRWDMETPAAQRLTLLRQAIEMSGTPRELQMNEARWLYLTAVLQPGLSDAARLEVLLYLLPRWQAWGQRPAFQATAHSIKAILSTSRGLRPDQRGRALAELRRAGVDTDDVRAPVPAPSSPVQPIVFVVPPPPPALPSDVFQAQEERRTRARDLAARPNDARARDLLAAALRAEDLARQNFYGHALASTPTPYDHLALAWDQVRWNTWRLLVARRAFGLSIVPEWERREGELEFALIKSWERFVATAADWMAAQPDVARADQGLYELWAWTAWAGEYGLYPRYPRARVWQMLEQSQMRHFAHPETTWRAWIARDESARPPWYMLDVPPK